MVDRLADYQPRATASGPLALLDESVSLFQRDPPRWLLAGWQPVLPLAIALLLFAHFHRVQWIDQQWGLGLQFRSMLLSLVVAAAWLYRSVAQGRVCSQVIAAAHPRAQAHLNTCAAPLRPADRGLSLAMLALLTAGFGLLGILFGILPGLVLIGFMAPVSGIIVMEGRPLSQALVRRMQLPTGLLLRGVAVVLVTQVLVVLAWVNIVAGSQLLVLFARMATGLDVGVLARLVSPTNLDFLLYTLVLAFFILEPLWVIQRSLLYLDAHLSQSGIDLIERWQELRGPGEPGVPPSESNARTAGLPRMLALLLLVATPSMFADRVQAGEVTALVGVAADSETKLSAEAFASRLEAAAEAVDGRITAYEYEGSADLLGLRAVLKMGGETIVQFADDSLVPLNLEPLHDALPKILHTDAQRDALSRLAERLRASAEWLRAEDEVRSRPAVVRASDSPSAADLLREELLQGNYLLPEGGPGGRRYREGLRDRVAMWLQKFLDLLEPPPPRKPADLEGLSISPVVLGLLAVVMLAVLVAVLSRLRRTLRRSGVLADSDGQEAMAPTLDARSRSPDSWTEQARALAAEQRYAEAVRSLFLATLARLDRNQEIDYRPDRTNGEHLRSFAGRSERRRRFALATHRFEGHWYGRGSCGEDDFQAMERLCSPLVLGGSAEASDGSGSAERDSGMTDGR